MKNHISLALLFFTFFSQAQEATFFDRADAFFSKYVKDGRVAYAKLKSDRTELDLLVSEIASMTIASSDRPGIKAFYVNSYNLLVIKEVVDRYPIESPLKVKGFFDGIRHTVMGTSMTLDELEKGTLYAKFPDPRLHFVLVCAAKGCPPLANYSYKPATLNEQLNERTTQVLDMDWFIKTGGKQPEISQIFSWYETDFLARAGSIPEFINTYKTVKIPEKGVPRFYEYDWSLNE